jgi:hypothetical protein
VKVYWIKLRESLPGMSLGVGITAQDWDDAARLLVEAGKVVSAQPIDALMIESWREVKDVAELERKHVRPNIGMIQRRGVWFPNLPEIE